MNYVASFPSPINFGRRESGTTGLLLNFNCTTSILEHTCKLHAEYCRSAYGGHNSVE